LDSTEPLPVITPALDTLHSRYSDVDTNLPRLGREINNSHAALSPDISEHPKLCNIPAQTSEDFEHRNLNAIASVNNERILHKTEKTSQENSHPEGQVEVGTLINQNANVIASDLCSDNADSGTEQICDKNTGSGTVENRTVETLSTEAEKLSEENLHTSSITGTSESTIGIAPDPSVSKNIVNSQLAESISETKQSERHEELLIKETPLVDAEDSAADNLHLDKTKVDVAKAKDEKEPKEKEENLEEEEEEEYSELTAADIKAEAILSQNWQPVFKTDVVPPIPPPTKCEPALKLEETAPSLASSDKLQLCEEDRVFAVVFLGVSVITDIHGSHYNQIGPYYVLLNKISFLFLW
jgi:hypothetical protein